MNALDSEYRKALNVIRDDAYRYHSDEEVFEAMIEEYLLREDGRLGTMKYGVYVYRKGEIS